MLKLGFSELVIHKRFNKVLLNKLKKSEYEFGLTGSYFFGTYRPDSDLDLFAKDSNEVRRFLYECNFNIEWEVNGYGDKNTVLLLRHHSNPHIDVQLVRDTAAKKDVEERIKKETGCWILTPQCGETKTSICFKKRRATLYDMLYGLYVSGHPDSPLAQHITNRSDVLNKKLGLGSAPSVAGSKKETPALKGWPFTS